MHAPPSLSKGRARAAQRIDRTRLALTACLLLASACGGRTALEAAGDTGGSGSGAPGVNSVDAQVPGDDSGIVPLDARAPDANPGSPDSGADATISPPGPDSGPPDAGADAIATPPEDAGADSTATPDGAPPVDAGSDAAPDAGPTIFPNAVQIDVSSLFNANTIVTTAAGGQVLTPVDGPSPSMADDNDFATATAALTIQNGGLGLPDDAFFPSNGTTIPNVQLAWTNAANVLNSLLTTSSALYSIPVPPANYTHVQLYAFSTNGDLSLTYALVYADASRTAGQVSLPDWCVGTLGSGEYILGTGNKVVGGVTVAPYICHLYAVDLSADPGKGLAQLTLQVTGQQQPTTTLVFYGAAAW
jgi:hypothetical protein